MWCHIRHINPQDKDPGRVKKFDKRKVDDLDYSGVDFPISVKHYNKVEKQNKIRINVFCYENRQPFAIYISKERIVDCINLLITKGENKRYVLIKAFSKSMCVQTKHDGRKHFCMYCVSHFNSEDAPTNHTSNCITINGEQAIKMPEKGSTIKFENYHRQLQAPFVIYADFEEDSEVSTR